MFSVLTRPIRSYNKYVNIYTGNRNLARVGNIRRKKKTANRFLVINAPEMVKLTGDDPNTFTDVSPNSTVTTQFSTPPPISSMSRSLRCCFLYLHLLLINFLFRAMPIVVYGAGQNGDNQNGLRFEWGFYRVRWIKGWLHIGVAVLIVYRCL